MTLIQVNNWKLFTDTPRSLTDARLEPARPGTSRPTHAHGFCETFAASLDDETINSLVDAKVDRSRKRYMSAQSNHIEFYRFYISSLAVLRSKRNAYGTIDIFINKVKSSLRQNKIDHAVDLVFEEIDGRLSRQDFTSCRHILERLKPEELDSNLIVAFLVITLPAKSEIGQARSDFFGRAKRVLLAKFTQREVTDILQGLK